MSIPKARLRAVATAVPPYRTSQAEVASKARELFGAKLSEFDRFMPVYSNAGVQTRYFCAPLDWFVAKHGWAERTQAYVENALGLVRNLTDRLLKQAKMTADGVDAIVTVSSTGIATPTLDARLIQGLPFRRNVVRLPIFGLGCAGGVMGLARAGALAQAMPSANILVLVVELCGLTFQPDDVSKSNLVATALFGDGAAGAIVSTEGEGLTLSAMGEHTWPDTLDVMGWRVADEGLGVIFAREIPALVLDEFRPALEHFLARNRRHVGEFDSFVCHPGGARVIDALERALDLAQGTLVHVRHVLRDYGNMSAPTVLFVLERALAHGVAGPHLMSALGPGFSAAFLALDRA